MLLDPDYHLLVISAIILLLIIPAYLFLSIYGRAAVLILGKIPNISTTATAQVIKKE